METKHTPGPWDVCEDDINVYAPNSDTAITNQDHICAPDKVEAAANARLIAAAPELLEALRVLLAHGGTAYEAHAKEKAREAIAKADGGAQ